MSTLDLILLGIVIASNNLSFSFGMGALDTGPYHLRMVVIFTVVEFTIPLLGLFAGQQLKSFIEDYAEIAGSVILIGLGLYTIYASFRSKRQKEETIEKLTSIKGIFLIALGLSLDNLLVGLSFGLGEVNPFKLASFIAFFSMLFTFIGLKTGKFVKSALGSYVQIFAGVVLVAMGAIHILGYP